jgi:flagellar hook-basal body complex protein FliE
MTFAVSGLGAVRAPLAPTASPGAAAPTGSGFADSLSQVVDGLSATQHNADSLAVSAATGSLANPHDYLLAATEASLTTQMTVAVRNKALEAFNEIMRMPL